MDYSAFYDFVREERARLQSGDVTEDARQCKALAALYELQDYLAGRIAETGAEE